MLGRALPALALVEVIDEMLQEQEDVRYALPVPIPNALYGWVLTGKCPTIPRVECNNHAYYSAYPGSSTSAQATNCLGGQALGPPDFPMQPTTQYTQRIDLNRARFNTSTNAWRSTRVETWGRPFEGAGRPMKSPDLWRYSALPAGPNPNLVRASAAEPAPPWPEPASPSPDPMSFQAYTGNGPPPVQHSSQPPRRNQREKKEMSRAKRVGLFLWNLMDIVSEYTEIAGALYDALPPEVREKWGCAKGVNIGQYGSDFNTCKANALYHNLHKLDTSAAFMNIAKMVAEDMTIGAFHKFISKFMPPGVSVEKTVITHGLSKLEVEAYIAKRLKEVFKYLGLE